MLDGSEFFECKCDSDEHTVRFVLDKEDKEIYLSVYLNQYRWWYQRVWVAIKYVFGYKCLYGHWDVTMFKEKDTLRLRDMCNNMLDITEPKEKVLPKDKPANNSTGTCCGVTGCTNLATHTWSGHPTCNACATPASGRSKNPDKKYDE